MNSESTSVKKGARNMSEFDESQYYPDAGYTGKVGQPQRDFAGFRDPSQSAKTALGSGSVTPTGSSGLSAVRNGRTVGGKLNVYRGK